MANRQALLDIIPVLRELNEADRFDMSSYAGGEVTPESPDYHQCKTSFCVGGAKAVVDGWRPQYAIRAYQDGTVIYEATSMFVRPEDRHLTQKASDELDFEEYDRRVRNGFSIGRDGFGLSQREAEFIFLAVGASFDEVIARIEWVADGKAIRNFEWDSEIDD